MIVNISTHGGERREKRSGGEKEVGVNARRCTNEAERKRAERTSPSVICIF